MHSRDIVFVHSHVCLAFSVVLPWPCCWPTRGECVPTSRVPCADGHGVVHMAVHDLRVPY